LARAFFSHVWSYYLFVRVFHSAGAGVRTPRLLAGALALSFVLLMYSWRLPSAFWLLSFLSVMALLPVQRVANRLALQRSPGVDPNTRWTTLTWVAIVVSGLLWLLGAIGMLIGEHEPAALGYRAAAEAI